MDAEVAARAAVSCKAAAWNSATPDADDTAWELCCRSLSQPVDVKALGTSHLAQLLVYWLEEGHLPNEMNQAIFQGQTCLD